MRIEDLIINLCDDPFNPELNFNVAVKYEEMGQSASAVTFYLRTAEYGHDTHSHLAYASLLRMAACFDTQNDRQHTVINCWRQAILVDPYRPEAFFILSNYYERQSAWQEAYVWATMGLAQADETPLPIDVGYPGRFALYYEKAVSGWWLGRREESIEIFNKLLTQDIPEHYRQSITENLKRINPDASI
jgi:tetratricopeptide (TPR) repeat protein